LHQKQAAEIFIGSAMQPCQRNIRSVIKSKVLVYEKVGNFFSEISNNRFLSGVDYNKRILNRSARARLFSAGVKSGNLTSDETIWRQGFQQTCCPG